MSVAALDPRSGCRGEMPLTGRLEDWQVALCRDRERLQDLVDRYGSPLNIHDLRAFGRNADELRAAAGDAGVALRIHFARKANRCIAAVDAARSAGLGLDVASLGELDETLAAGVAGPKIVVTAAVKTPGLIERALAVGADLVLDNEDEFATVAARGPDGFPAAVGARLCVTRAGAPAVSRFGLEPQALLAAVDRHHGRISISGLHFHVDGYAPDDRVDGARVALDLADELRRRGHPVEWLDIGGGVPMSYLDDPGEWERFWIAHREGLVGDRPPLTYAGHGLGLLAVDGRTTGTPNVYPAHAPLARGAWLRRVLETLIGVGGRREPLRRAIGRRDMQLRIEPGRSLLDGCGMTAARVVHRTQRGKDLLVALEMNRTQCRTTADEFPIDPLLVMRAPRAVGRPTTGFLVGAYCVESELLVWRRLVWPFGVEPGDLVVFPNTAGYFMHITESRSHGMPLAANLLLGEGGEATRDPGDRQCAESSRSRSMTPR